ncbi:MAG: hypothetical protein LBI87_07370 [Candidatus Accumulibacter sp.]|jgi:hypothetical protein|nr:hypothetical protein [Accumulibacter sp.]
MADGDKLREILEKGETIRWNSSTQAYGLFDEAHKKSTSMSMAVGLAVGIFLTGGYLWLCLSRNIELKNVIIFLCLGISLLVIWSPISTRKHLSSMRYAITDKRVIALSTETDKAITMPLSALDAMRVVQAGPETCHILLGSSISGASGKKLTALAMHGQDAEGEDKVKTSKGVVFYNISAGAESTLRVLLQPLAPRHA